MTIVPNCDKQLFLLYNFEQLQVIVTIVTNSKNCDQVQRSCQYWQRECSLTADFRFCWVLAPSNQPITELGPLSTNQNLGLLGLGTLKSANHRAGTTFNQSDSGSAGKVGLEGKWVWKKLPLSGSQFSTWISRALSPLSICSILKFNPNCAKMPSILSQFGLLARVCPYDSLVKCAKSLGNLPLYCLPALNLLNSHPIYDIFLLQTYL